VFTTRRASSRLHSIWFGISCETSPFPRAEPFLLSHTSPASGYIVMPWTRVSGKKTTVFVARVKCTAPFFFSRYSRQAHLPSPARTSFFASPGRFAVSSSGRMRSASSFFTPFFLASSRTSRTLLRS
jgi:hypothetical protein